VSENPIKRLRLKVEVETSNSKNDELDSGDVHYFIQTGQ
jgi:hypothetical protein